MLSLFLCNANADFLIVICNIHRVHCIVCDSYSGAIFPDYMISCCSRSIGYGVFTQEQSEVSWQSEVNHMPSGQPATGQTFRLWTMGVQTWHQTQTVST